jgi:hypothetical protein
LSWVRIPSPALGRFALFILMCFKFTACRLAICRLTGFEMLAAGKRGIWRLVALPFNQFFSG